jgi:hypothetical protein
MVDDSSAGMLERWRKQEFGNSCFVAGIGVLGLLLAGLSRHPNFRQEDWSVTKAALIFGGCALVCWVGFRTLASLSMRKPVPPGSWLEPFLPVVRSDGKRGSILMGLVAATLSGAGGATAAYFALTQGPAGLWIPAGIGLLGAALGLVHAINQFLELQRFGRAELRFASPPAPGKPLAAELVLGKAPPDLKQVTVKLECTATRWELRRHCDIVRRRPGSKRSDNTQIEWDPETENAGVIEQTLAVVSTGIEARCLMQVPLPADFPPTDAGPIFAKPERHAEPGVRYHRTLLSVTAEIAGVDLGRTFSVAIQG